MSGLRIEANDVPQSAGWRVDSVLLADILNPTLREAIPDGAAETTVALSFVDGSAMRKLNFEYRDIDAPTDVLSFSLWESAGEFRPPADWRSLPLGDVVVCLDSVADNAAEHGVTCGDELVLVIIHGILHLIGYDHDTDERESRMWELQDRLKGEYFARLQIKEAADAANTGVDD